MSFPLAVTAVGMNSPGASQPLLRVRDLRVEFAARAVLQDINFDLSAGETLGLVGESGSGKSTLARAIVRLVPAAKGRVLWQGRDLLSYKAAELRRQRRDLQMVFQDPLASLNPRLTIGEAIAEPVRIFEPTMTAIGLRQRVEAMLARVGLSADMAGRYPHEFSGGQCQRIGIARAMSLNPKLLICDEAVSSLDVSIQGQIVNLLLDLQQEHGTAMLFISHNLAIVRHVSHRILVLYLGRLVEVATCDALFERPIHPYTRTLLAAVPSLGAAPSEPAVIADARPADGAALSASSAGCVFRDRCAYAVAVCSTLTPPLTEVVPGHLTACHRAAELMSGG